MLELPLKNKNRTMDLLNKTCLKNVPTIYAQDGLGDDAIAYLKFFINDWTWFVTELDQKTGEAFGKVYSSGCPDGELGYISMIELSQMSDRRIGHAVERDRYWKPTPLKDVKNPLR